MGARPPVDRGIRLLQHFVASAALCFLTTATAFKVLGADPTSIPLRAGLVTLAVAAFLYWMWVVARVIQAQDEFSRRLHLIALGVAFALTGLFVFGALLLQQAHFVYYVPLWTVFVAMATTWWLSIVVMTRYYR